MSVKFKTGLRQTSFFTPASYIILKKVQRNFGCCSKDQNLLFYSSNISKVSCKTNVVTILLHCFRIRIYKRNQIKRVIHYLVNNVISTRNWMIAFYIEMFLYFCTWIIYRVQIIVRSIVLRFLCKMYNLIKIR